MISSKKFMFVIITLANLIYLVNSLKTIGESCDDDCDERLGLVCATSSKICECMLPNATIYDENIKSCVTKAGHLCRRFGNDPLCISHASCEGVNLPCTCNRNYFQTRNGTCLPVANFGESCSSRKACDKAAGMECVGSKNKQYQCQCKYGREHQYYDSIDKKCISYAGSNCSGSSGVGRVPTRPTPEDALSCVKNAACSNEILELKKSENIYGKAYQYNATAGKTCACLPGYRATRNRTCLSTYRSPCDDYNDNNVCNLEENLKCFDNRICLCKNPLHQVYNSESHKCENLVGSSCEGSGQGDCVSNSECRRGICTCNSGFSVTPEKSCLKDFGENCTTGECNFARGLVCGANNLCSCLDGFLVYSQEKRECFSVEGSPCGMVYLTLGDEGSLDFKQKIKENCGDKNLNNVKMAIINCRDDLKCEPVMGIKECVK